MKHLNGEEEIIDVKDLFVVLGGDNRRVSDKSLRKIISPLDKILNDNNQDNNNL